MTHKFDANCWPTLIGSLPMDDHPQAFQMVRRYTPEIPLWVQLPGNREEGMLVQFLPGFPGIVHTDDSSFVDTDGDGFETELITFYEDYLAIEAGEKDLLESRFAMTPDTAAGFFELMSQMEHAGPTPVALKGQITGPITLGTGLTDKEKKAVFYNDQVRDALVKHIAMKARFQAKTLARFGHPVIVFFDEPALTSFGSSAFISITKEQVAACFDEVIQAVHAENGLTGIHVCANAEWSLLLESPVDIISFDAYAYFDRFVLYPEQVKAFFASGRILALGIVPTLNSDDVAKESVDSLYRLFKDRIAKLEALGIDRHTLFSQILITPACGTGSLSLPLATKVLEMTQELSARVRADMN